MTITRLYTSAAAAGLFDVPNGNLVTKTVWDALVSDIGNIGGVVGYVGVSASRHVDQSIPNNTLTAVSYTVEDWDSDAIYPGSGTQLTIVNPGIYLVLGYASWATNTTGRRQAQLVINGGVYATDRRIGIATDPQENFVFAVGNLTATMTVIMNVFQDSGGALAVNPASLVAMKL